MLGKKSWSFAILHQKTEKQDNLMEFASAANRTHVRQEEQVKQVMPVSMEYLEILEHQVPKVNLVLRLENIELYLRTVSNVRQDRKDPQDQRDLLDQLVQKEDQEMLEPQAKMEMLVLLGQQAQLDNLVVLVKTVLKGQMVEMVKLVPKVKPEEKDPLVDQDLKDQPEMQVQMANQALKERQDLQEQQEMQVKVPLWVDQVVRVELVLLAKMPNIVHVLGGLNWLRKPKLKYQSLKENIYLLPQYSTVVIYSYLFFVKIHIMQFNSCNTIQL